VKKKKKRTVKFRKTFTSDDFSIQSLAMQISFLFHSDHRRQAAVTSSVVKVTVTRSQMLWKWFWVREVSAMCSFTFKKRNKVSW
jgi:hypothetical protein